MNHYIYKDGKILEATLLEWAKWFEGDDGGIENRRIEYTEEEEFCVSTVFIGIDHGFGMNEDALLFETCILRGPENLNQHLFRYATVGDAKQGHYAIVRALRNEIDPEWSEDFRYFCNNPSIFNLLGNLFREPADDDDEFQKECE